MKELIHPTINSNGTSPENLLKDLRMAIDAVTAAMDAMVEVTPNGRDYYPQGPEVVWKARDQHFERVAKLDEVRAELLQLAVPISEEINQREDARRARQQPTTEVSGQEIV
jgi:hypothetical protein